MKVSELIKALSEQDPNLEVVIYTGEDDEAYNFNIINEIHKLSLMKTEDIEAGDVICLSPKGIKQNFDRN